MSILIVVLLSDALVVQRCNYFKTKNNMLSAVEKCITEMFQKCQRVLEVSLAFLIHFCYHQISRQFHGTDILKKKSSQIQGLSFQDNFLIKRLIHFISSYQVFHMADLCFAELHWLIVFSSCSPSNLIIIIVVVSKLFCKTVLTRGNMKLYSYFFNLRQL